MCKHKFHFSREVNGYRENSRIHAIFICEHCGLTKVIEMDVLEKKDRK